eukprot:TRINITY_DN1490_c0_g2_i1.p1 TRINITY_DN1490_c0_g2~~TRINITY_DN1490_c0_g2_i1.p1  ORF type:complete len:678 (+),score=170.29 TRINITY_DN1490_c0_g2_i1:99-2036(+)
MTTTPDVVPRRWYSLGPQVTWWRWLVLFTFSVTTGMNSFMFMNFATVESVSKQTFGWVDEHGVASDDSATNEKLNWLYSAGLFAVIAALPVARLLITHNWLIIFAAAASNCTGAWLRYVAVANRDYGTALFSSIILGIGNAIVVTSCAYIPALWFPKGQQAFATSATVMANYAGWAFATVVTPHAVTDTGPSMRDGVVIPGDARSGIRDLEWMVLVQAFVASTCPIWVLLFHREHPGLDPDGGLRALSLSRRHSHEYNVEVAPEQAFEIHTVATELTADDREEDDGNLSGSASCRELRCRCSMSVPFLAQGFCHSLLGGISFVIPAVQTTLFSELGFSHSEASWTHFAFVMTGVVVGLLVGELGSRSPHLQERILAVCYLVTAVSITVVSIVAYKQDSIGRSAAYPVYIIFMAGAGAGSLGFVGVALVHVGRHLPSVSPSYSAGSIEVFIQVFGAVFAQISTTGDSSAAVLIGVSWATTVGAVISLYGHRAALQDLETELVRTGSVFVTPAWRQLSWNTSMKQLAPPTPQCVPLLSRGQLSREQLSREHSAIPFAGPARPAPGPPPPSRVRAPSGQLRAPSGQLRAPSAQLRAREGPAPPARRPRAPSAGGGLPPPGAQPTGGHPGGAGAPRDPPPEVGRGGALG